MIISPVWRHTPLPPVISTAYTSQLTLGEVSTANLKENSFPNKLSAGGRRQVVERGGGQIFRCIRNVLRRPVSAYRDN